MIKEILSSRLQSLLDQEREALYAARVAVVKAAKISRDEGRRAFKVGAALRAFEWSREPTLAKHQRAIRERFGASDLVYLSRRRASHPRVKLAVAAALALANVSKRDLKAYRRATTAEELLKTATAGPLLKHAREMDRLFGTRDFIEAAPDGLRFLH